MSCTSLTVHVAVALAVRATGQRGQKTSVTTVAGVVKRPAMKRPAAAPVRGRRLPPAAGVQRQRTAASRTYYYVVSDAPPPFAAFRGVHRGTWAQVVAALPREAIRRLRDFKKFQDIGSAEEYFRQKTGSHVACRVPVYYHHR
jgi:hypothetical protein